MASDVVVPMPTTESQVEVLKELLSEQKSLRESQERSLRRLNTVTAQQAGDVKKIQRKFSRFLNILAAMFLLFVLWILLSRWNTIRRYNFMVEHLRPLEAKGLLQGSTAAGFALSYDLPWARAFVRGPANEILVSSTVVQGFYSAEFSPFLVKEGEKYVPALISRAKEGKTDGSSSTPRSILCDVVGKPNGIYSCLDLCPGPLKPGWEEWTTNILDWGMQGGFLASFFLGPFGIVAGLALGAAAGAGITAGKSASASSACSKAQSPCIDPDNLDQVCGKTTPPEGNNSPNAAI